MSENREYQGSEVVSGIPSERNREHQGSGGVDSTPSGRNREYQRCEVVDSTPSGRNRECQGCEVVDSTPSGKNRVRVTFDNGVTCLLYRGEARQLQIEEGASLTGEQYEYLMTELLGRRAKKRALYSLEKMDRTEQGLRELLQRSEYPIRCIDDAVDYVKAYRYLDDERYASNYVRIYQGKLSRWQLRQKLMARGVSGEIADRILDEEYEGDEELQLQALLAKRHFDPRTAEQKERNRTCQYLMRRGFSSEAVRRAMEK